MTFEKLIYDVREMLKLSSNDTDIDDRYIEYLYSIKRSKYLRQELNSFQKTTDISITQTVCLELEEVSINQCNIDLDCTTIVRTKRPIPKPIELHVKPAITQVRTTNRIDVPFNFMQKERAIFSKFSNFSKGIYAFLDTDLHIYFISNLDTLNLIECITVTAIFEDPLDLITYKNCCKCNDNSSVCFDLLKSDYPLQPHYIDIIKNEIVKELTFNIQIPEDNNNNSDDDKK
jgi:hypothetical protein